MSADGIGRINLMRSMYQARETNSSDQVVRTLQEIKNEIKILNDEQSRDDKIITNATGSPYFPDQSFNIKNVVYNSAEETSWKDVKSFEQTKKEIEENFVKLNKRKLDII